MEENKSLKKDNKEKYESFYNFMHSKLISETTTIAEALKSFEENNSRSIEKF